MDLHISMNAVGRPFNYFIFPQLSFPHIFLSVISWLGLLNICTLAPDLFFWLFQCLAVLLIMHLLLYFLSHCPQHHLRFFSFCFWVSAHLCSGNLFLEIFLFHWNLPLSLLPIISFNSVLSLWPWLLTLLTNQWSDGYVIQFSTKKQQGVYENKF